MCLRRSEKACALGEPALSVDRPQVDSEWYLTLTYVMVVRLLVVGDYKSKIMYLEGVLQLFGMHEHKNT